MSFARQNLNLTPATDDYSFTEYKQRDCTKKLPDEVLCKILSILPPDEAIRTSILSTGWKYLWKSADFVLDFDGMEYLAELYQTTSPISDIRVHLPEKRTLFKNRVNQILTQLYSCRVIKFRVAFNLTRDCNSEGEIDRWVRFAISKRLESLHLDLHIDNVGNVDYYVFSEDCYNHIKTPVGMSEIGSLRSLHLCFVDFRDEIFEVFVANCPLLEELVVKDSSLVTKMRVVGLSKLKHLEVRLCWFLRFIDIDCNPSLTRFAYEGCERVEKFRVGKCPSLVDLTLVNSVRLLEFAFRSLSGLAHRLESLFLKSDDFYTTTSIRNVAEHTRLERLTIEICGQDGSYRGLIPLINACPRLHTLQLFLHTYPRSMSTKRTCRVMVGEKDVAKLRRESIKVMEIVGFNGYGSDCEFVKYVMDYFVGLERIVIDRGLTAPYRCEGSIFDGKKESMCCEEQGIEARRLAMLFKAEADPSLEFIII